MELVNKYAIEWLNKTLIFNFWNDRQNQQIIGQIDQAKIEKNKIVYVMKMKITYRFCRYQNE